MTIEAMKQALEALELLRSGLIQMRRHAEEYGRAWAGAYVEEYQKLLSGSAVEQFRILNALQDRLADVDEAVVDGYQAIASLRQAIAEAEKQEPVAWFDTETGWTDFHSFKPVRLPNSPSAEWLPLYTHPPKREPLTEWLPIETAPKDGTAVLVMRDIWPGTATGRAEKCTGHNTYVAAWWADEGNSGEWVCYMDRIEEPICPIEPTHWMPLPPPPIEAAHGIKE